MSQISDRKRLILFTRYPEAGRVKTRLIPALGAEGAAMLHRRLVSHALSAAEAWRSSVSGELEIRFDGGDEEAMRQWLGEGMVYRQQGGGDLGERLARAFEESCREGGKATVVIGSDCPALGPAQLGKAFRALSEKRVVLGPATDGGYYLIGLTRQVPELFHGIEWGTGSVLAKSLGILAGLKIEPFLLEPLDDIDRPEDLKVLEQIFHTLQESPAD